MQQIYQKVKTVLNTPFILLDTIKRRTMFAMGLFFFSMLFLLLFVPFNISQWIVYTSPFKGLELLGLTLISGAIILISQLIQAWFFAGKELKTYNMLEGYMFDAIFISIPLSILYSIPANSWLIEFWQTFKLVALLLALGYLVELTIFALVEMKREKDNSLAATKIKKVPITIEHININDENGQLRLSLKPENLLFFESADNYVIVHYYKEQRIAKEIIRTSLKNIEAEFSEFNCIRCHRSYIVNLQNVLSIKKEGRSYEISIKGTALSIPISRSYIKMIKDLLN